MKGFIAVLLLGVASISFGQDLTPIVVNIRNNPKIQFNGNPVKMRAIVQNYVPVHSGSKDFKIVLTIKLYENNAGAYGPAILTTIGEDVTLSEEERTHLLNAYADRTVVYTTVGKYVDANGSLVADTAPGAIPETLYWQNFKLNQVAGMGSLATQGAFDAQYLIIRAIVNKMDSRKNF